MEPLADTAAHAESLATPIARESHLHGPRHWRDVARVASRLRVEAPDADPRSLFLLAAVHDTQRLNDSHDPEHGARAASVLDSEIDHGLDPARLALLLEAMKDHSGSGALTHDSPTIGACWDADRLTLDRVGIPPEQCYISTPSVRAYLARFRAMALEITGGPDRSWDEIAAEFQSG